MLALVRSATTRTPRSRVASSAVAVCSAYVLGLAGAELLLLTSGLVAGAVAHAALIGVLLLHATAAQTTYRRLLVVLVVPSLIRLLGLTIPVAATPVAVWYLSAGTPALVAALLAARTTELPRELYRLPRTPVLQLLIALTGVASGLLAYLALRPPALAGGPEILVVTAVAVAVFAAITEELVFRGSLQSVATDVFENADVGMGLSTLVFGLMYIGSQSVPFILIMGANGLFFGWAVRQTGSLWGATFAHAALAVGLVVVWPVLLP